MTTRLDELSAELDRYRPRIDELRAANRANPQPGVATYTAGAILYFEAAERIVQNAREAGYPDCDERTRSLIDSLSLSPIYAIL